MFLKFDFNPCFFFMVCVCFFHPRRRRAALFCVFFFFFLFLFSFFLILKPDRLSSQLQGCIAVGTPSFPGLPELLLPSPARASPSCAPARTVCIYGIACKEDLLARLRPGSPRSWMRGPEDRVKLQKTQGGTAREDAKDRGRES